MLSSMSDASPDPDLLVPVVVKFAGAVLVCGDCERRGSGPKKLRAKEVRKTLKRKLGNARFRLRIVQSSCLGLCPKKAMTLLAIQPETPLLAAEVKSEAEVAAFSATVLLSFR